MVMNDGRIPSDVGWTARVVGVARNPFARRGLNDAVRSNGDTTAVEIGERTDM